jgi:hypothetical protein
VGADVRTHQHRLPTLRRRVDGSGRWLRRARVIFEAVLDDLEREEVLSLLLEDPPQSVDVVLVELSVARWRPFRVDQPLALEESDLRDGDVRELLAEQGEDVADGQV